MCFIRLQYMKQKLTLKNIGLALLSVFVLIQFFRIDRTNTTTDPLNDLINFTKPPAEVAALLKTSCYDCHSNEVKYPWYTNIAPFSWWIKHHINEGREELNMSEWGSYKEKRKKKKIKESIEMLEEGEMPLDSYTWLHGEAKLSGDDKEKLMTFFRSINVGEVDTMKHKVILPETSDQK